MKCLVLGGGGFIGSHLCEALVIEGHKVRLFQRAGAINIFNSSKDVEIFEGDFTNKSDLERAIRDTDTIFHLISTTLPKNSNEDPIYDINTNIISTLNLLNIAKETGVRKIIYSSSGGTVYGLPQFIPISEEHSTNPLNSYGIHKLTIEKYLGLYHQLYNIDYNVMRISNPYGERQKLTGSQGAIAVFLYKALKNESIEIWGDGEVVRDYLHVSDVVSAAIKLMYYSGEEKIFNIGSGKGKSLNEIVYEIEKLVNKKLVVNYSLARQLDVPINILDIKKAMDLLEWKPETLFEVGLQRTFNYIFNQLY